ncbi:MAG: hypothetical protein AB1791_16260 [Chloroflexota bacterium]
MRILQSRSILIPAIAFVAGLVIGWFVIGWGVWPVEFTGAGPQHLHPEDQANYLRNLADLFAFDGNQDRVRQALGLWPEADQAICALAGTSFDPADVARLTALAAVLNGVGCAPGAAGTLPQPQEQGRSWLPIIIGLSVLLLGLLVGIYLLLSRRGVVTQARPATRRAEVVAGEGAATPPARGLEATPVAHFETTYVRGNDAYDDSFSIENANGDFLGECGVGVSEAMGMDVPRNVTAFEVWLFDKNDIRTITKVIMSDAAYFDDALKAKLAPKGEPVLARPGETIALETATLIVNAHISELEYSSGVSPAGSAFERFTVELSAWVKPGGASEQTVAAEETTEILDF